MLFSCRYLGDPLGNLLPLLASWLVLELVVVCVVDCCPGVGVFRTLVVTLPLPGPVGLTGASVPEVLLGTEASDVCVVATLVVTAKLLPPAGVLVPGWPGGTPATVTRFIEVTRVAGCDVLAGGVDGFFATEDACDWEGVGLSTGLVASLTVIVVVATVCFVVGGGDVAWLFLPSSVGCVLAIGSVTAPFTVGTVVGLGVTVGGGISTEAFEQTM